MSEMLGKRAFAEREPLLEAGADRGAAVPRERDRASRARDGGDPDRLRAVGRLVRAGQRDHRAGHRRDRAARRRARAARERGAVPADRQLGAGDDVGDAARPGARFRQRGLCAVRVRPGLRPRAGADDRLAHAHPPRRRRPDRRREHRRRGFAAGVHARGPLPAP